MKTLRCSAVLIGLAAHFIATSNQQGSNDGFDPYVAMYIAAGHGDAKGVARLLDKGLDVERPYADGETLLMRAASKGSLSVVDLLLERGAEVDRVDSEGCTALLFASGKRGMEIARRLLKAGADPNGIQKGTPPLTGPAAAGDLKLIALLLRAGSKLDLQDRYGHTALVWAVEQGQERAVRRLLQAGADPTIRDYGGRTPYELAVARGNKGIARLLAEATKRRATPPRTDATGTPTAAGTR